MNEKVVKDIVKAIYEISIVIINLYISWEKGESKSGKNNSK